MASKKSASRPKSPPTTKSAASTSAPSTVSGPARGAKRPRGDDAKLGGALVAKMDGVQALAAGMPFNANKPGEHGKASAKPQPGQTVKAARCARYGQHAE